MSMPGAPNPFCSSVSVSWWLLPRLIPSFAAAALLALGTMQDSKAANCGGANQAACEKCEEFGYGISPHFGVPPPRYCKRNSYSCNDKTLAVDDGNICRILALPGIPPLPPPSPVLHTEISVAAIPDTLVFTNPDGSQRMATGLVGYRATITNAGNAYFGVPDARALGPSCDRLDLMTKTCTVGDAFCTKDAPLRTCGPRGGVALSAKTCTELGIRGTDNSPLTFPMFDILEWSKLANPRPPYIIVNTNWFDIRGPRYFPYNMPCTDVFGYLVNSGTVLSQYSKPDHQRNEKPGQDGTMLDAFVVTEATGSIFAFDLAIKTYDQLQALGRAARLATVKFAVGGFVIARDGIPINSPESNKPTTRNPRSAIGLSADGRTMTVVVVQGGPNGEGLDAELMARFLVERLGASTVLNLDNSGSSQFLFKESDTAAPVVSVKGDRLQDDSTLAYRPVPAVLVISTAPKGGVCKDDKCTLAGLDQLRKRDPVANPLDLFDHTGQFYSNDPYLSDDAHSAGRGSLDDCARKCLAESRCATFTYAYANSGASGQFCTLFPSGITKLPTRSDYQLYTLR